MRTLAKAAMSEKCQSPEVSCDHFIGAFFLDKASRVYEYKAGAVLLIVEP
jgi:hypothetical protein